MNHHPQNPYSSYVIEASAGSGKTYQLSQRFLKLVAAGCDPQNILTVTFTVKAAAEMRERIIKEALLLLHDPKKLEAFDRDITSFYKTSASNSQEPIFGFKGALKIVQNSQNLKISTIDSLFAEWVNAYDNSRGDQISSFLESQKFSEKAWEKFFDTNKHAEFKSKLKITPLRLKNLTQELFRHEMFLWRAKSSLLKHSHHQESYDQQSLWNDITEPLSTLAKITNSVEESLRNIRSQNLEGLQSSRLLTQEYTVSQGTIRGQKREFHLEEILFIEDCLKKYINSLRLMNLNSLGESLLSAYLLWESERNDIKKTEFSDFSKNSHALLTREHSKHHLWFIGQSTQHLLIDEFQDTNIIQWEIFEKLCLDILSTKNFEDPPPPSAFIVGDKKQSIYGFREADPALFDAAKETFAQFEKKTLSLDASYRTCQIVLDYINDVFENTPSLEFRKHLTAKIDEDRHHIPNCGGVFVFKSFAGCEERSPVKTEAQNLAKHLKSILENSAQYPIWRKNHFRPITPKDCAILFRQTTHIDEFISALREEGIPFRKEEKGGFFSYQPVQDLICTLNFIQDPKDFTSLLSIMKSQPAGFTDEEIFRESKLDINTTLRRLQEKSKKFYEAVIHYQSCKSMTTPSEITGSLAPFFEDGSEQTHKNLSKFQEIIAFIERTPKLTLAEILEEVLKLEELNEISLEEDSTTDCVSLLTIHKSKGLEYPLVWIVECGQEWFQFDRYWLKTKEGLYFLGNKDEQPLGDLKFDRLKELHKQNLIDESQRLLYVALTRTSQYLFISGHQPKRKNQEDSFIEHLFSTIEKNTASKSATSNDGVLPAQYYELSNFRSFSTEEKIEVTEKFSFELPNNFFNKDVRFVTPSDSVRKKENITESSPFAKELGIFIHKILELKFKNKPHDPRIIWRELLRTEKNPISLDSLYNEALQTVQKTHGHPWLKAILDLSISVHSEAGFVHDRGDTFIKGAMDLLIVCKDKVHVIDFKTSQPTGYLLDYAESSGHIDQIKIYGEAAQQMHPDKEINQWIFFTKIQEPMLIEF